MKARPDRSQYDRVFEDEGDGGDIEIHDGNSIALESMRNESDSFSRKPDALGNGDLFSADEENGAFDPSEPSAHEMNTLRRVPDRVPWSAFLVAIVELCERFTFYGLSGPFQNYITYKYENDSNPGALGMGQASATALTNFFIFWCYVTPIFGAIVADQYLGKYKAIVAFSWIYLVGLTILFLTSLPISIERGYAYGGLITAMIVIGLGTGGIKSNVSPLIAEQITETRPRVRVEVSGERVLVDPILTIQRVYMIFYMCINIGGLSAIATTNMELYTGFWSAYLLALCMFAVGLGVLISGKKRYIVKPPKGSIIAQSFRALWMARKSHGLEGVKPSYREKMSLSTVPWDDVFVDELRIALNACKVFSFLPIYWLAFGQMSNNFISQAGTMQLHGIPNDLMQNINPISIIFLVPLFDRIIYPLLRRLNLNLTPITRITLGFTTVSLAMLYATFIQHSIYTSPPCFSSPLTCPAAHTTDPITNKPIILHNEIHVAWQAPAYILIATSEIFASITGLEYAYTKAPSSMKSFIMSVYMLITSFGAVLGMLVSPFTHDPNLVWLYGGLAVTAFGTGIGFWFTFRKLDNEKNMIS